VIYPYSQAVEDQVNGLIDITVNPRYSGRVSNFFVNWPGFLIWAPALFGYDYNADIETNILITRLSDMHNDRINIPASFKFRQAALDRTWTEIGWLEVSLIPFIGGFVMTQYDPDVTDTFIKEVSPIFGEYVSRTVIEAYPFPQ